MANKLISGYEVIRGGQVFSTREPEKKDIIKKVVYRGSGGRQIFPETQQPMTTKETPTPSATVPEKTKTTPTQNKPSTKTITSQLEKDSKPLGDYKPVYQDGKLLGFQKGSEFVPKESARTKTGLYKPQYVKLKSTKTVKHYGGDERTSDVMIYETRTGYLQEVRTGENVTYISGLGGYGHGRITGGIYTGKMTTSTQTALSVPGNVGVDDSRIKDIDIFGAPRKTTSSESALSVYSGLKYGGEKYTPYTLKRIKEAGSMLWSPMRGFGGAIKDVYIFAEEKTPGIKIPLFVGAGEELSMVDVRHGATQIYESSDTQTLKGTLIYYGAKGVSKLPTTYGGSTVVTFGLAGGVETYKETSFAISQNKALFYGLKTTKGYFGYKQTKNLFDPSTTMPGKVKSGAILSVMAVPELIGLGKFVSRQWAVRYSPDYTPIESTGIKFVPKMTEPISQEDYSKIVGSDKLNIHVTRTLDLSKLPGQQIVLTEEAGKYGAGAFRQSKQLYGFYASASLDQPKAYLGYAGITSGEIDTSSAKSFKLFTPGIKAYIIEGDIQTIPKSELTGFETTRDWIRTQTGKFPSVENIYGLSKEGQITLPAKSELGSGTILQLSDKQLPSFTYYKETKDVPSLLKGGITEKVWDVTTSKYHKINMYLAEVQGTGSSGATNNLIKPQTTLNVRDYSSSYGTKYYDLSSGDVSGGIVSKGSSKLSRTSLKLLASSQIPKSIKSSLGSISKKSISPITRTSSKLIRSPYKAQFKMGDVKPSIKKYPTRLSLSYSLPKKTPPDSPPYYPSRRPPTLRPPRMPKPPGLNTKISLRKSTMKIKQPQGYVASFTGAFLNIRGSMKPILNKFKFGYMPGIRPIQKRSRRKPKKKKKS